MEPILQETFRYHKWANLHLLDVCSKLTDEQLELTALGTYGTIAATLVHLLAAEQRYLRRITGDEPQISEKESFPGVAALIEHATRTGDELIALAGTATAQDTIEAVNPDGHFRIHVSHFLMQALHHGNDHRTHICTVLGYHELPYGDIDVWAYSDSRGLITPLAAK